MANIMAKYYVTYVFNRDAKTWPRDITNCKLLFEHSISWRCDGYEFMIILQQPCSYVHSCTLCQDMDVQREQQLSQHCLELREEIQQHSEALEKVIRAEDHIVETVVTALAMDARP